MSGYTYCSLSDVLWLSGLLPHVVLVLAETLQGSKEAEVSEGLFEKSSTEQQKKEKFEWEKKDEKS